MDKIYLEELLKIYSMNDISEISGKSLTTVRYWCKKYNLTSLYRQVGKNNGIQIIKTNSINPKLSIFYNKKRIERLNSLPINDINEKIKLGIGWREIGKEYKLSFAFLSWLFKNNHLIKTPEEIIHIKRVNNSLGKKHTEETKRKLSKARTKYLADNGLKPFYNKAQQKSSWLCETVKQQLKEKGIVFVEEFMPLKEQGRYFSIDIAIPERKIAFEINGRQHYDAKWNLLPYYQNRHNLIEAQGWKVHEIKYDKNYMNIVEYIIKELEIVTNNQKLK